MGWIGLLLLSLCAQAEDLEHKLSWAISVDGKRIGQRDVTVKYVPGEVGQRRILESWTEVDGTAGSMRLVYRQRMTAHAADREPASFHSVMEQNGVPVEVQARWTPSAWWVTTNTGGRQRTVDVPVNRIDISTADLFDPDTRFPLARFEQVRMLSAETGETLVGPVKDLGTKDLAVAGTTIQVQGFSWDAPMGTSTFWFNGEGFLVSYDMVVLGIRIEGRLMHAPPPGIDDFAVGVGRPKIEVIDL